MNHSASPSGPHEKRNPPHHSGKKHACEEYKRERNVEEDEHGNKSTTEDAGGDEGIPEGNKRKDHDKEKKEKGCVMDGRGKEVRV